MKYKYKTETKSLQFGPGGWDDRAYLGKMAGRGWELVSVIQDKREPTRSIYYWRKAVK